MTEDQVLLALSQMEVDYRVSSVIRQVDDEGDTQKPPTNRYTKVIEFTDGGTGAAVLEKIECKNNEVPDKMLEAVQAIAKKRGHRLGNVSDDTLKELQSMREEIDALKAEKSSPRHEDERRGWDATQIEEDDEEPIPRPRSNLPPDASTADLKRALSDMGVSVRKNATDASIRRLAMEHEIIPTTDDS